MASSIKGLRGALLDTIAGTESPGYNVMYGGTRFGSYAAHPGVAIPITSGPNVGKTSSAAGRYQFLERTWKSQASKLGLTDFSPASQDVAAYDLAAAVYKQKTGSSLDAALASGDPEQISAAGKALSGTWTSLPGGIEAGTNSTKFYNDFQKYLANPSGAGNNTRGDGVDGSGIGVVSNTTGETSTEGGSGSIPQAIDKGTAAAKEATATAAASSATGLQNLANYAKDYIGRIILVLLGIVFVAGGVFMFGRSTPAGQLVARAVGK